MPPIETPTEPNPPSTQPQSVKVAAGRYGELEAHELVHLLDSIEDDRARGRFREAVYISTFVWIAIAWFIFYGPRYLWHAPELRDPVSVLKERELTELRMPMVPRVPVVKPPVRTTIDNATMKTFRDMAARRPAPVPTALPNAPQPQPVASSTPPPPPPVANTPQPRTPPPPVADAPTMQPQRPNFGTPSSAGNAVREAMNDAAHSRGGTDSRGGGIPFRKSSPLDLGGMEVLSDLQGVDFDPYFRRMVSDVQRNWDVLIPQEVLPPLNKEGDAWIRLTILPDGSIGSMHLDGSSHDVAIDKSCWGSITSEGKFPPLPSGFHGPNVEVRFHYSVHSISAE